jgi:hypothetical protein
MIQNVGYVKFISDVLYHMESRLLALAGNVQATRRKKHRTLLTNTEHL